MGSGLKEVGFDGTGRAAQKFRHRCWNHQAIISVHNPIRLGEHSEPQPDLALLKPRADF